MAGDPTDEMEQFLNHLLGYPTRPQLAGTEQATELAPPDHWFWQGVQLRYVNRSVIGTIPANMCQQAGINRENPPKVTAFYDPHTGVVLFDLQDNFEVPQR